MHAGYLCACMRLTYPVSEHARRLAIVGKKETGTIGLIDLDARKVNCGIHMHSKVSYRRPKFLVSPVLIIMLGNTGW